MFAEIVRAAAILLTDQCYGKLHYNVETKHLSVTLTVSLTNNASDSSLLHTYPFLETPFPETGIYLLPKLRTSSQELQNLLSRVTA